MLVPFSPTPSGASTVFQTASLTPLRRKVVEDEFAGSSNEEDE
jgi:hypothetical protein